MMENGRPGRLMAKSAAVMIGTFVVGIVDARVAKNQLVDLLV
jgi:hypothetical protein